MVLILKLVINWPMHFISQSFYNTLINPNHNHPISLFL